MSSETTTINKESTGGRLRSRTFSHRPSPIISPTTSFNIQQQEASMMNSSSNNMISNLNGPSTSFDLPVSPRRRSKSAFGIQPNLEYKNSTQLLSSSLLLDKYEEDLSQKLNKIESSNLSIKNLFNHKRKLSFGSSGLGSQHVML